MSCSGAELLDEDGGLRWACRFKGWTSSNSSKKSITVTQPIGYPLEVAPGDDYLTMERAAGTLIITRSARVFRSEQAIIESWSAVHVWVESQESPRRVIIDQRRPQGRNHPAFEALILNCTRPTIELAERGAILVESAAGKLQLTRHMEAFGAAHFKVCREVQEAIRAVGSTPEPALLVVFASFVRSTPSY